MLVPFRKEKKWGYSTIDKNIVINPIYDSAELFREGLARVRLGDRIGFIDSSGKVVIPLTFEFAHDFYEGRALVCNGTRCGFVDETGRMVIPAKYGMSPFGPNFRDGFAVVEYPNGKSGYIDLMGREITGARYDRAYPFSEGMARVAVEKDALTYNEGFIDKTGKEVIPLKYHDTADFSDGLALVTEKKGEGTISGYIDKTGATVIPFDYGRLSMSFSEGLAFVNIGWYAHDRVIDRSGKVVFKYTGKYRWTGSGFHDGLARVSLDKKIGYIDKTGAVVIPMIYDDYDRYDAPLGNHAGDFSGGIAVVCLGNKFGLIDKSGKMLTQFKYASIPYVYDEGFVRVCLDKDCYCGGYVGRDGTEYFEP